MVKVYSVLSLVHTNIVYTNTLLVLVHTNIVYKHSLFGTSHTEKKRYLSYVK